MNDLYDLAVRVHGTYGDYKWEVSIEDSLEGEQLCYYHAIAPDGYIVADGFTSGPIEDGVNICKTEIEEHMSEINQEREEKA